MDSEHIKRGTYLTEQYFDEQLERMVSSYLDFAESMTLRHIPLTMQDWETRLNNFIMVFEYGLLKDSGKVSAEITIQASEVTNRCRQGCVMSLPEKQLAKLFPVLCSNYSNPIIN